MYQIQEVEENNSKLQSDLEYDKPIKKSPSFEIIEQQKVEVQEKLIQNNNIHVENTKQKQESNINSQKSGIELIQTKQTFCEDEYGSQGSEGEFDALMENILNIDNEDEEKEEGSGSMPKSTNSLQDDPETKMILEEIHKFRQSQRIYKNDNKKQKNNLYDSQTEFQNPNILDLPTPTRNKEINSAQNLQTSYIKNLDNGEIKSENDLELESNKFVTFKKKKKKKNKKANWTKYWQEAQRFHDDLIDFCYNQDINGLAQHLNQHHSFTVNINCKQQDNKTIAHVIGETGSVEILEFINQNFKDFNINALTSNNQNALHIACLKGNLNVCKKLIEYKININQQDDELNTPLHIASMWGKYDIVQFLLEQKDINLKLKNQQQNIAEDVSENGQIYNLFQENQLGNILSKLSDIQKKQSMDEINKEKVENYKRFQIGENIYRKNSRTDQVQNILNRVQQQKKFDKQQQQNLQNSKISNANQQFQDNSNNVSKVSSQNSSKFLEISPKSNIKNKIKKFENIMQYTQQDLDLVGPKDFIYLDKLGKGSFGNVYLVQRKGDPTLYAMKTLRKDRVFSKNLIKYVQAEQSILSTMNHPFIVGLKYAFQTVNKLYLVMQYCPGGDLEGVLIDRGKLKEDHAKMYLSEILLALQALHKEKIVFRDLKPQNVVIDEDGHALLIDFGLSRQGVQKKNVLTSFCGSLAYLAPEMLDRKGHNFTIDYYLFGLLIYELLSGYPPFYTDNKKQLFQNIRNQKLKYPRYFSKEAKDIIEKLMKRNPEERLGALKGAEEIKQHPFFADINWKHVYNRKNNVPKPFLDNQINPRYHYENKMYVTLSEQDQVITDQTNNYIANWAFVNNKSLNN